MILLRNTIEFLSVIFKLSDIVRYSHISLTMNRIHHKGPIQLYMKIKKIYNTVSTGRKKNEEVLHENTLII